MCVPLCPCQMIALEQHNEELTARLTERRAVSAPRAQRRRSRPAAPGPAQVRQADAGC
jgi:hypothetical protein